MLLVRYAYKLREFIVQNIWLKVTMIWKSRLFCILYRFSIKTLMRALCSNRTKWVGGSGYTYPEICMIGVLGYEGSDMMVVWRGSQLRRLVVEPPETPPQFEHCVGLRGIKPTVMIWHVWRSECVCMPWVRMVGWGCEGEDGRMRMRGRGCEDEDVRARMVGWGCEGEDVRMRMWGRGW